MKLLARPDLWNFLLLVYLVSRIIFTHLVWHYHNPDVWPMLVIALFILWRGYIRPLLTAWAIRDK